MKCFNNLLAPNQSDFKLGDSCTNQVLSITCEIYFSLDDRFKVRSVFFDISNLRNFIQRKNKKGDSSSFTPLGDTSFTIIIFPKLTLKKILGLSQTLS